MRRDRKKKERKMTAKGAVSPWLRGYYGLRRRLGLAAVDPERERVQSLLYPAEDAALSLAAEDEKRLRMICLTALISLVLTLLVPLAESSPGAGELTRPAYGGAEEEVQLRLRYREEEYRIPLTVESRRYTDAEWQQQREAAWEAAQKRALGENSSWDHICSPLDFSGETGVEGITVTWESEDTERIGDDGSLGKVTEEEAGQKVGLTAVVTCEDRRWERKVTAVLYPPTLSPQEETVSRLEEALVLAAKDRDQGVIRLPEEVDGAAVEYLPEDPTPRWLIPVLGALAAGAFWMLPEQRRREAKKAREKELALAYPELIGNLTVLMGAGLTVRSAWEKIVKNYRRERDGTNPVRRQVLYEEMYLTLNQLGQGVFEEQAYVNFGKRCGLSSYLRLGSLLEANIRQGSGGLIALLQEEADNAMEERLQMAKRQGEEASSKLLIPMMLLFALVLVILIVPALLTF